MKNEKIKRAAPVEEVILVIMVVFSLVGIVITDHSPQDAFIYWMSMFFVFGIAAMTAGWYIAKVEEDANPGRNTVKAIFKEQSLHWLGSLAVVACLFTFVIAGHMTQEVTGLMVLMVLALATFLDGIRIGWRFSLAGIYLAVAVIAANLLENFMVWMIVLAIFIIVVTVYLEKREEARLLQQPRTRSKA